MTKRDQPEATPINGGPTETDGGPTETDGGPTDTFAAKVSALARELQRLAHRLATVEMPGDTVRTVPHGGHGRTKQDRARDKLARAARKRNR